MSWGGAGSVDGHLALCSTEAVTFFLLVPTAAAAHLAGSLPAAGAGQPARVPTAPSAPPAATIPSTGLAGACQQHPPEAPADLHCATAPTRGPSPGNV